MSFRADARNLKTLINKISPFEMTAVIVSNDNLIMHDKQTELALLTLDVIGCN